MMKMSEGSVIKKWETNKILKTQAHRFSRGERKLTRTPPL